ncbi:MAG: SDR family oxidoreductase [Janthinobacterium lividum]
MFRDDLLAGKRILITGGGTGLGKELADEFLRLGAEVHICGRRKNVLDGTAAELMGRHGGLLKGHVCDVRVAAAVDDMIGSIWSEHGPLSGLVNNAAGNILSPTERLSTRAYDAVQGIVMDGSFYATHACGKRWIEAGLPGSVLSMLVTWVWNGSPYTVPSAMSKAAINIMTKSLAVEWARHGIRLNALAPGSFPTKGAWERLRPGTPTDGSAASDHAKIPMGRVGDMSELRNIAAFLMADGCDYLTGTCIAVDGGKHLATGGNYADLSARSDEEWEAVVAASRAVNAKDRAQRSV